jgi:hypothetical protein
MDIAKKIGVVAYERQVASSGWEWAEMRGERWPQQLRRGAGESVRRIA